VLTQIKNDGCIDVAQISAVLTHQREVMPFQHGAFACAVVIVMILLGADELVWPLFEQWRRIHAAVRVNVNTGRIDQCLDTRVSAPSAVDVGYDT
jgi:hypothetical protein